VLDLIACSRNLCASVVFDQTMTGGVMKGLKMWRMVCAYAGAVSLAGVCSGVPLLFKETNAGEVTALSLLYILFGSVCLLVGVLRFFLSAKAGGIPFLLAALAFLAVLLRLSPLLRSLPLEWALLVSVAGAVVGFLQSSKAVTSAG
jgi:hypothetical protein